MHALLESEKEPPESIRDDSCQKSHRRRTRNNVYSQLEKTWFIGCYKKFKEIPALVMGDNWS